MAGSYKKSNYNGSHIINKGQEVNLNLIENVSLFVGYNVKTLDDKAGLLNMICEAKAADQFAFEPVKEKIYGVFSRDEQFWARGKVLKIHNSQNNVSYYVYLLDIADYITVEKKDIIPLPPSWNYPPESFKAGLDGVLPNVALSKEQIVLLLDIFHSGKIYFKVTRIVNEIKFGKILIEQKDENRTIDLTNELLTRGLVKQSNNFETDVNRLYKETTKFEEERKNCLLPKEFDINHERSNMPLKSYNENMSQPALQESCTKDHLIKPFINNEYALVPACYHPKQLKQDKSGTKQEVKKTRTYYEIQIEKQKQNGINDNNKSRSPNVVSNKDLPSPSSGLLPQANGIVPKHLTTPLVNPSDWPITNQTRERQEKEVSLGSTKENIGVFHWKSPKLDKTVTNQAGLDSRLLDSSVIMTTPHSTNLSSSVSLTDKSLDVSRNNLDNSTNSGDLSKLLTRKQKLKIRFGSHIIEAEKRLASYNCIPVKKLGTAQEIVSSNSSTSEYSFNDLTNENSDECTGSITNSTHSSIGCRNGEPEVHSQKSIGTSRNSEHDSITSSEVPKPLTTKQKLRMRLKYDFTEVERKLASYSSKMSEDVSDCSSNKESKYNDSDSETSKELDRKEDMKQQLNKLMAKEDVEHCSSDFDDRPVERVSSINILTGVLVHTSDETTVRPVSTLSESTLDPKIVQRMEEMHLREMSRIQKYTYTAISDRRNVAMISGPRTGKTAGYAVPIASNLLDDNFYLSLPKGCGPRAIVVTPYWPSGDIAARLFQQLSSQLTVIQTYGGGAELEKKEALLRGCDVLVSTPKCLMRILDNSLTDLSRLCHVVLDDTDILIHNFKLELEQFIVAMKHMEMQREKKKLFVKLQLVLSSAKWTATLEELVTSCMVNPVLCIASQLEACVYTGIKPVALFISSGRKLEKLIEILKELEGKKRTVVMCKGKDDVKYLYKLLLDLGVKNVIAAHEDLSLVNISEVPASWYRTVSNINSLMEHSVSLPILLSSDEVLDEYPVTNAQVLIHYNMPTSLKTFSLRFTCLMANYRNVLKKELHNKKCEVTIMMDEENDLEMSGVMNFMARLGTVLPKDVQCALEKIEDLKQEKKITQPLCEDLKQFGRCWDVKTCHFRHIFNKEYDVVESLPRKGHLKISVQYIHNVCHFSAWLLEHAENGDDWRKTPNEMVLLSMKMNSYYNQPNNKKLHGSASVGDLVAVESSFNCYHRAIILDLISVNKRNEPETVNIRLIDNGRYQYDIRVVHLYALPEEFKSYPPAVVDIYLCNLLPKDQDMSWSPAMYKWLDGLITNSRRQSPHGYICGKIVLSLGTNIWLDPVHYLEHLPGVGTTVALFSLRTDLLSANNAVDNPDHIIALRRLCEKANIEVFAEQEVKLMKKPKIAKPNWAWLPQDKIEEVYIIMVPFPNVIFVRLCSFTDLMTKVHNEIQEYAKSQKDCNYVKLLDVGDVCLGWSADAEEWSRAIIKNKLSEEQVELFFVDYGDSALVTWSNIRPISDELITKIPFQAIECYLAGVKFPEQSGANSHDWSNWEDNVIDEICNLSRLRNEEAQNTLVKVVGVESVGNISSGKRYKVVLSNCESKKVLNKQLVSMGLAEFLEDDAHFLETDMEYVVSDSGEEPEDKCDVLLPEDFDIEDEVVSCEENRIFEQFIKDVKAGRVDCCMEPFLDEMSQTNEYNADISESDNCSTGSLFSRCKSSLVDKQSTAEPNDRKYLEFGDNSSCNESVSTSLSMSISKYEGKKLPIKTEDLELLSKEYLEPMNISPPVIPKSEIKNDNCASVAKKQFEDEEDSDQNRGELVKRKVDEVQTCSPYSKVSTPNINKSDLSSCEWVSPESLRVLQSHFTTLRHPCNTPVRVKFCTNLPKQNPFEDDAENPLFNPNKILCRNKPDNYCGANKNIPDNSDLSENVIECSVECDDKIGDSRTALDRNAPLENDTLNYVPNNKHISLNNSSAIMHKPNVDLCIQKQERTAKWVKSKLLSSSDDESAINISIDCVGGNTNLDVQKHIEESAPSIMNSLEDMSDSRHPKVEWYQDDEFVWIEIKLLPQHVTQYKFQCQVDNIEYRAFYEGLPYRVCLSLFGAHNPTLAQCTPKAFHFEIKLFKFLRGKSDYWPRLIKQNGKLHWLKPNVEKVSENLDDSEDEDMKMMLCSLPHWNDNPIYSDRDETDVSEYANSELSLDS